MGIKGCTALCVLFIISSCVHGWQWPDEAESVRIDSKVRFLDPHDADRKRSIDQPEAHFQRASDTRGFYNRAGGSGRLPVTVESEDQYRGYDRDRSDGTLDSLRYCKCVAPSSECAPHNEPPNACAAGMMLCCYNGRRNHDRTEINEVYDTNRLFDTGRQQRPVLVGPTGSIGPSADQGDVLVGPSGPTGIIGPSRDQQDVLVGPSGPTGIIGPNRGQTDVLVGPGGPTGIIGPVAFSQKKKKQAFPEAGILTGPDGPTGIIGPHSSKDILVGPGGPTGIIGPDYPTGPYGNRQLGQESAQRGVLVGPGGPTGVIGPGYNNRPVLVGPGGPTGIIGPGRRPVLVGPGGPTGIIGPSGYGFNRNRAIGPGWNGRRPVLVGPGGYTGYLGPRRRSDYEDEN